MPSPCRAIRRILGGDILPVVAMVGANRRKRVMRKARLGRGHAERHHRKCGHGEQPALEH
ncbi:MAG: hypothetical protein H0V46_09035 [Sphingomonas sp.]|nr:hypothetical protein [Sphingomonas sp.]